ncbi:MAG: pseudouridine-5'-phosphate glycosidase [Candidatus Izemoplasmatales bacterium]|nr:pseudouridine-5'-phosphate glycosidase [bacterium]MDZ4196038.1 pseudouridine-5'-phosphate glycosidase [Candidatus Izemoplasmatales bacterium]
MIAISPSVQHALSHKLAVVALESTIISHGMPYPENVHTALECERIIRDLGAIPATIAIMDGILTIGLTSDQIDTLGRTGQEALKVSRRDIPYAISKKRTGALTVAGTMIACQMAGISVFATGGIGGVHRHAETTFDISADLEELANTNVCVVSAGMKSILDLPKTMEYLETKGVPVIGYGTDVLPAFYTRNSPYPLEYRFDSASEIARFLSIKWKLGLQGGVVVANPIPEEFSFPEEQIEEAIQQATIDMENFQISGKKATPFLLERISQLTKGKSLQSNIALVYSNCRLAAQIALELCKEDSHETK